MTAVKFPPLDAVRVTLNAIDTPALDVYTATGLSPSWQQSVKEGRAKDPSYNRICTLIVWLEKHHTTTFHNNVLAAAAKDS